MGPISVGKCGIIEPSGTMKALISWAHLAVLLLVTRYLSPLGLLDPAETLKVDLVLWCNQGPIRPRLSPIETSSRHHWNSKLIISSPITQCCVFRSAQWSWSITYLQLLLKKLVHVPFTQVKLTTACQKFYKPRKSRSLGLFVGLSKPIFTLDALHIHSRSGGLIGFRGFIGPMAIGNSGFIE